MKIKTSELTGAALDWAVAKIEGHIDSGQVVIYPYRTYDEYGSPLGFSPPVEVYYCNDYRPSTKWAQGGLIIEREGILLRALRNPGHTLDGQWLAMYDSTNTGTMVQWVKRTDWPRHYLAGPTPLVAAMRCFVASKLGEEVEVPDELG